MAEIHRLKTKEERELERLMEERREFLAMQRCIMAIQDALKELEKRFEKYASSK